jgi:integrase
MIIAFNTGLHPGEITGLKWSYIDRDAKMIRLPLEAIKEGKKTREKMFQSIITSWPFWTHK